MQLIANSISGVNILIAFIVAFIIFFSVFYYLYWVRRFYNSALIELNRFIDVIENNKESWSSKKNKINSMLNTFPSLLSLWLDTEERIIKIETDQGEQFATFSSLDDLWNPSAVLNSINFRNYLAKFIQYFLYGAGILLILFGSFLIFLDNGTSGQQGDLSNLNKNLSFDYLNSNELVFYLSFGFFIFAISWNLAYIYINNRLSAACSKFLKLISSYVKVKGTSFFSFRNYQILSNNSRNSDQVIYLLQDVLSELRDKNNLEKSFQLTLECISEKLSNLNKSICNQGEVINNKLTHQNNSLVEVLGVYNNSLALINEIPENMYKLVSNHIDSKIEAMKEIFANASDILILKLTEANQKIVTNLQKDFSVIWNESTKNEISNLQLGLDKITTHLNSISAILSTQVDDFKIAGSEFSGKLLDVSKGLDSSATSLNFVTNSFKTTMRELDSCVINMIDQGKRSVSGINEILEKSGQNLLQLHEISSKVVSSSFNYESVIEKISTICKNLDLISSEQMTFTNALREFGPNAQTVVERMASVAEYAGETSRASLESTATSLTQTVSSISTGVSEYSYKVAELHRKMDDSLAKAVIGFDLYVSELSDSVEALSKVMQEHKK